MESHIIDITHVIQLTVAPVFLLTAVATLITALNNRLERIVDRRRVVLAGSIKRTDVQTAQADTELRILSRRAIDLLCDLGGGDRHLIGVPDGCRRLSRGAIVGRLRCFLFSRCRP